MTPLNNVRKNEAFKGLSSGEAFSIHNYYHFRAPIHAQKVALNARKEGVYNDDFLDNIEEDYPKNAWSMLQDTLGQVAVLRNKLWPGFAFTHKSNSNIYCGFYVGGGIKSLDVPFMF